MSDALGLVRRFASVHYPEVEAALLAGSQARDEARTGSDYDVILLFASLPDGAWREMVCFEAQYVEVFAHDPGTLAYFCREVDRVSGVPALPAMVAEGISALSRPSPLLAAARETARGTLRLGPLQLSAEDTRARRYAITDFAAVLRPDCERGRLVAAAASLYTALADFALRAGGHWSASGKALPQALMAMDETLAARFATTFDLVFAAGDVGPVQALVDAVLAPYGGRLRHGFRLNAPAAWRDNLRQGQGPDAASQPRGQARLGVELPMPLSQDQEDREHELRVGLMQAEIANKNADSELKREQAAKAKQDWRLDPTRVVISAFLAGAAILGAAGTIAGYLIGKGSH